MSGFSVSWMDGASPCPFSFSFFGAAFNLGFATGPAIGGLLADTSMGLAGFHAPIFAAAALAAGSVALLAQLALDAITSWRAGSTKMPWPKMPRAAKLPSS